jgi:hypothetical protein
VSENDDDARSVVFLVVVVVVFARVPAILVGEGRSFLSSKYWREEDEKKK